MDQDRTYQRIDSPHHEEPLFPNQSASKLAARAQRLAVPSQADSSEYAQTDCDKDAHAQWRSLHRDDLIERLQAWADDLDAREAQINLRSALQDQRERQFRLAQQGILMDLKEKQLVAESTQADLHRKARQFAFETDRR